MTKICIQCGNEFESTHHAAKLCSPKCRRARANDQHKACMGLTDPLFTPHPSTCGNCGNEYMKRAQNQHYCSIRCRESAYRKRSSRMVEKRVCPNCKKEFTRISPAQIYCSVDCGYSKRGDKKSITDAKNLLRDADNKAIAEYLARRHDRKAFSEKESAEIKRRNILSLENMARKIR